MARAEQRTPQITWRRPCGNTECVEFAHDQNVILIRDSKLPGSPVLSFSRQEIQAFVEAVARGELDDC
jgi:Domain of unknown function (DUF397)